MNPRAIILFLLVSFSLQAQETPANTAIIVMDMQDDFTKHVLDSAASETLIKNINTLIAAGRSGNLTGHENAHNAASGSGNQSGHVNAHIPASVTAGSHESSKSRISEEHSGSEIIFVKAHIRMLEISFKGIKTVSSPNLELDSRLSREEADPVFMKQEASAFTLPEFNQYLEENQISHLVMSGLFLGQCLSATTLQALEKGYDVTVIPEATIARKAKKTEKLLEELADAGAGVVTMKAFTKQH